MVLKKSHSKVINLVLDQLLNDLNDQMLTFALTLVCLHSTGDLGMSLNRMTFLYE